MNSNQKRKIMLAMILVAIVSVGIVSTYAYFITSAGRNEEQKLTIKTGTLSLVFEDNDEGLTDQIMLGESRSKEFRIRNTGTEQVTTNMLWSGLVNTYLGESLSYNLEYKTSEEGDWQSVTTTSHTNIPQSERTSDYNLATGLTIPSGATYFYRLTITFNNLPDINQEADKTAILSTKFKLGDEINEYLKNGSLEETIAHLNLKTKAIGPETFAAHATTDETVDGLFPMEDDYGLSYYYRGAVENNYVKFSGFYWRIIRINGDGSIRMIYDGDQAYPNANGEAGSGGTKRYISVSQSFNDIGNDNKYMGWMFGGINGTASSKKDGVDSTAATYNETDSTLKKKLDDWYKANIVNKKLEKYIGDEIFCNDRSTPGQTITGFSRDTGLGYGNKITAYGATARTALWTGWPNNEVQASITFKCPQKNDAFTVKDTEKGNGALTYPIGLITEDEVTAAGDHNLSDAYGLENKHYYLFKNDSYFYWTMTPGIYDDNAYPHVVTPNGYSRGNYTSVKSKGAIAPVINISPEYAATLTGSGTMDSPYQIPGVE